MSGITIAIEDKLKLKSKFAKFDMTREVASKSSKRWSQPDIMPVFNMPLIVHVTVTHLIELPRACSIRENLGDYQLQVSMIDLSSDPTDTLGLSRCHARDLEEVHIFVLMT
jgi:hypothetical protein